MGLGRTKMDENSEYASGEYAGRHSLSPQSSVLFSQEFTHVQTFTRPPGWSFVVEWR